jgi:hypothetical protein
MPKKRKNKQSPFTKPLTAKRARKEIKAAGRLAVGPEQKIIQAERRTSKVQSRRIRDWFPQYGQAVQQAGARTAAAYQGADEKISSAADASTNYAETLRQRLAQEGMADAAKRGVAYDDSGSNVGAQAQLARINSSDTLRGVTASQGAAQAGYYADKKRIGEREKVEQLLQEQERRRSYTQQLQDLAKRKSDTMIQEKGRLRDSERDYHLGLLAAKEPGKARKFERGQAAKDRKLSKSEAKKDRRFDRNQAKQDRKAGAGGDGGSGKQEAKRERKAEQRQDVRKVIAGLEAFKPKFAQKALNDRRWAISEILRNENEGISPADARKAYKKWKRRQDGHWGKDLPF